MTLPSEVAEFLTLFFKNSTCIAIRYPNLLDLYGSDIDCISHDVDADLNIIKSYFAQSSNYSMRIKPRSFNHYHIDILSREVSCELFSLLIRIDLYHWILVLLLLILNHLVFLLSIKHLVLSLLQIFH